MAKTVITAESDFSGLVEDMLQMVEDWPEAIHEAAEAQLQVFESAIKGNWVSMVPWASFGDYVHDSIGYNVEYGNEKNTVVGMAGVFLLDSVNSKHGKDTPTIRESGAREEHIKAPQLAYWAEFGYTPNNGSYQVGVPFMSNAYYATLSEQDKVFADTLSDLISMRLSK